MEPISNNPEYFENCIQNFSQINEQFHQKGNELEERINTLAEVIVKTEEKLESLHKANDELESKINQINSDMKKPNDKSKTRFISWLRKYELLCDSIVLFIACGATTFFLAYAIPIMLTSGGLIFFIHFLVREKDIKKGELIDGT